MMEPLPVAPEPTMEFNHAVQYVAKVKERFYTQPAVYEEFLVILRGYQENLHSEEAILEVKIRIHTLFVGHPDLLEEFSCFLPDSVKGTPVVIPPQSRRMMARKPGVPKQRKCCETPLELLDLPDVTLVMILHFDSNDEGQILRHLCQLKRTSRHFEKLCTLAIRSLKRLMMPITPTNQDAVLTHCRKLQAMELYNNSSREEPRSYLNWRLAAPKYVKILETNRSLTDITLPLDNWDEQIQKDILQAVTCPALSLQRLCVYKSLPTDIDLVPLLKVHAKSLKELRLSGAFKIDSTEVILPNLETLDGGSNTFIGFMRIAPNLHTLHLGEDAAIEDFRHEELQLLGNLRAIYSSILEVGAFYVLPCQKYPNLTDLELKFTLNSIDISPIAQKCPALKRFKIENEGADLEIDGILKFLKFCKTLEEFMCHSHGFVDVIRLAKEQGVSFPGLHKLGFLTINRSTTVEISGGYVDWCLKLGSVTANLQVLTIFEYGDEYLDVVDILELYYGGLDLEELYHMADYFDHQNVALPWRKNIFPNMKIYGTSLVSRKNGQVIVTPHCSADNGFRFLTQRTMGSFCRLRV